MINVTKEQIQESLERLSDYGYLMYFSDKAEKMLSDKKIKYENHEFFLKIEKDGNIRMILENNVTCLYQVCVTTAPPINNSLDNLNYNVRILSLDDKNKEYLDYFNKTRIFLCSYFQRAIAFIFFSRIAKETIEEISKELVQCNKKENN